MRLNNNYLLIRDVRATSISSREREVISSLLLLLLLLPHMTGEEARRAQENN